MYYAFPAAWLEFGMLLTRLKALSPGAIAAPNTALRTMGAAGDIQGEVKLLAIHDQVTRRKPIARRQPALPVAPRFAGGFLLFRATGLLTGRPPLDADVLERASCCRWINSYARAAEDHGHRDLALPFHLFLQLLSRRIHLGMLDVMQTFAMLEYPPPRCVKADPLG